MAQQVTSQQMLLSGKQQLRYRKLLKGHWTGNHRKGRVTVRIQKARSLGQSLLEHPSRGTLAGRHDAGEASQRLLPGIYVAGLV